MDEQIISIQLGSASKGIRFDKMKPMITNFQLDPARPVSNETIRTTVKQALKQGFNGVGTVSYLLGEELKLLIQGGKICELLLKNKNHKLHLPGERFEGLFEPSRLGYLKLQTAPGRLLLCERACFDRQFKEQRKNVPNGELEKLFCAMEKHESASIAALRWNKAQAYVLIPGANLALRRAIFIGGEQIELDDSALAQISNWSEPYCEISIYQGALETDSWIMLHLNILFEFFCEHLLKQYGYLTGRTIVNSMIRNMIFAAPHFGFELTNVTNTVQDQTMFISVTETVSAYTGMLDYMEKQFEAMVGVNFNTIVKNQGLELLNPFYINLARFYGFKF